MVIIDGIHGEGGGQVLRTSLALSLVTGQPFSIKNIRAGRKKSGLMRQHLTCVKAAAEVGSAAVQGDSIGSQSLTFQPKTINAGKYHFAIGTAGSCTLVLQTVLPALLIAKGDSRITLEGGTHNPFAPPFDFLEQSFLGIINKMGPGVSASLHRPGFYPAGGGKFTVNIHPSPLKGLEITQRGEIKKRSAKACVANLSQGIAAREIKVVKKLLGWEELEIITIPNSQGPGNVLTLTVESENITEVFTGFGIKGVSAEKVAKRCVNQAKSYLRSKVPVGRYLADQLLIPMAMAGSGRFLTLPLSRHTTTNIDVIKQFMEINISHMQVENNQWEIRIKSSKLSIPT